MNTKTKLIVSAVLLVLVAAPTTLFVLQNADRVTGLSLNAGLFAVKLAQPVAIPALMGITFAVGFLAGVVATVALRRRAPAAPVPIGGGHSDPWT